MAEEANTTTTTTTTEPSLKRLGPTVAYISQKAETVTTLYSSMKTAYCPAAFYDTLAYVEGTGAQYLSKWISPTNLALVDEKADHALNVVSEYYGEKVAPTLMGAAEVAKEKYLTAIELATTIVGMASTAAAPYTTAVLEAVEQARSTSVANSTALVERASLAFGSMSEVPPIQTAFERVKPYVLSAANKYNAAVLALKTEAPTKVEKLAEAMVSYVPTIPTAVIEPAEADTEVYEEAAEEEEE